MQLWAFATNPSIGSAGVTISTGNPNHVIGPRLPATSLVPARRYAATRSELDRLGAAVVGAVDDDALEPTPPSAGSNRTGSRVRIRAIASSASTPITESCGPGHARRR